MKRLQIKTRRFLRRAIQYGSFYVFINGFLWGFLQVSSSAYRRMEANPPAATAVSASPDGTLSLSILTKQAQLPQPIWQQSEAIWIPTPVLTIWQMIWNQCIRHDDASENWKNPHSSDAAWQWSHRTDSTLPDKSNRQTASIVNHPVY